MNKLNNILQQLDPISLKEMDRVKLQNRTDTKFVFEADLLPIILNEIKDFYSILEIKKNRTNSYKTLYYDTKELKSYIQHHNGKANRTKIRFRKYIESDLNFLEVKFKNNKGRTIKARKKISDIETTLSDISKDFINNNSTYKSDEIIPVLWNSFTRLTLVHKTKTERLTIDLNLGFKSYLNDVEKEIPHIIIAEVKQEKASNNSDFIQVIKKHHVRKSSMSKYCVGSALLNKDLKQNNFKERILKINKLKNVKRITA
ncbi:MAG: polyphosphate polymerase domain-containing protein [Flavobacteriales bacterium]|nr:polyphosphate polymerase domain-containing protein [Flavobacteriales bacterium]